MTVTVKLFAILRDLAGVRETTLDLADGNRVTDAVAELAVRFAGIQPHLSRLAYAVNEQYVKPDTELHDGDELALIPPVSGG
jgi:molybdopterin converting factor subunit 1